MLKIDPDSKTLLALGRRTLEPGSLFAQRPVADLIANSSDVFFRELDRRLFLVGRDISLGGTASRRADLLMLDPEGRLVVGRLQHGNDSIDLVEALEDTGRLASWGHDRILALLRAERRAELQQQFLKVPVGQINSEQGLLLLAESYNLDTLSGAGWLKARYGVRIDCFRLRLATDSMTQLEYLSCQDLSSEIDRIYQSRKSSEPDEAPWPAEAVPDISDAPVADAPVEEKREPATVAPVLVPEAPEPAAPAAAEELEPGEPETFGPTGPAETQQSWKPEAPKNPLEAEVDAALNEVETEADSPEIEPMRIPDDLAPEDDPLAGVIAGLEAAGKPEDESQPPSDRRLAERSRDFQARRLRLDYFGRLLGARLVDFSSTGLGVEALSPLPVGAEIGISGEITGEAGSLGIEGRAKVEHCRSTEDGVCRIGFSLGKAKVSELEDPETFDRR